ncbi:MAG: hypothetical protein ACR2KK_11015 [Acidimicrobiales bacterium]
MSRDFYGEARTLAVRLAEADLGDWARKLEEVIEAERRRRRSSWAWAGTFDR